MANKFPTRGDFSVLSSLFDEYEWHMDYFIDGELGIDCELIYPTQDTECVNCYFDTDTKRSSNTYRVGGPSPFENFTICPVCGGTGKGLETEPHTSIIRVRYYPNSKDFIQPDKRQFISGDGIAQIIGYQTDSEKIKNAVELRISELRYVIAKELLPWGFRGNRYFSVYLKRAG
jgi:hypothetical protein